MQQGSPIGTSSALKFCFFSGNEILCSEWAGVPWFENSRIFHKDYFAWLISFIFFITQKNYQLK